MPRNVLSRAELIYVRSKLIWRFWALGYHRAPSKSGKWEIVTFAFGPLRLQFLDWGKRWRFQREAA